VIKDAGEYGHMAVSGTGCKEHAGGFGTSGAGREHIIDEQNSLPGDIVRIAHSEAVSLVFTAFGQRHSFLRT
jgi:hypothetical protein